MKKDNKDESSDRKRASVPFFEVPDDVDTICTFNIPFAISIPNGVYSFKHKEQIMKFHILMVKQKFHHADAIRRWSRVSKNYYKRPIST
jgi:hypothetical protein